MPTPDTPPPRDNYHHLLSSFLTNPHAPLSPPPTPPSRPPPGSPTQIADDYGRRVNTTAGLHFEPDICPGSKQRCSSYLGELLDPLSRFNNGDDPARAPAPGSLYSRRPANQIKGWTVDAFYSAIRNATKVAAIAAGQVERQRMYFAGKLTPPALRLKLSRQVDGWMAHSSALTTVGIHAPSAPSYVVRVLTSLAPSS
jgi:hypothetical protein